MRAAFIFLALLAVEAFGAVQIGLRHIESRRSRLIKKGVWKEYAAKRKSTRLIHLMHSLSAVSSPINDYDDLEYISNITIGTPGQPFIIVMDTGSSNLWIPDSTCETTSCNVKNLFTKSKSSSYVADGTEWSIGYGDGSTAEGYMGKDTVTIPGTDGSLVIPKSYFGQATYMTGFDASDPIDGIFGLGFKALSEAGVTPPLINAVEQGLLDEPLFTVWMEHRGFTENVFGGIITFGGIDTTNCGSIIAYQPLSEASYWQFTMSGIASGTYKTTTKYEVISDTGTSFIGGPSSVIKKLAKAMGGQYDSDYDLYTIGCSATAKPLIITIGSNNYQIEPVNLKVKLDDDYCSLSLFDFSSFYGPQFILGDPFIRQYCQIQNIKEEKIGFAKSKQDS